MAPRFLTPLTTVLRSVSQIFLLRNAPAGALILLALAVVDVRFAGMVLLGAAVESLTVYYLDTDLHQEIRDGLRGYNGALIGAAWAIFIGYTGLSVTLTVLCALATIIVHNILQRMFVSTPVADALLPVATGPFCIVIGGTWTALDTVVITPPASAGPTLELGPLTDFLATFADVVLVSGALSGLLIIIALFVADWHAGIYGLYGAALAMAVGAVAGTSWSPLSGSLHGYSAVLVAIALGATFWNNRSILTRFLGVTLAVVLTLAVEPLLIWLPGPTLTWPFLISLWAVMLLARGVDKRRELQAPSKVLIHEPA